MSQVFLQHEKFGDICIRVSCMQHYITYHFEFILTLAIIYIETVETGITVGVYDAMLTH
jgi:hypothetical protein